MAEPQRNPSVHGRMGKSFKPWRSSYTVAIAREQLANILWEERIAEVESERGSEEEEESEDEECGNSGNEDLPKSMSMGSHLQDRNVFAIEVVSKRYLWFTILSLYVIIIFWVAIYTSAIDRSFEDHDEVIISVRVNDTSICYRNNGSPDDPCLTPFLTSEQAALLSNTVVVAEGIDASQWDGGGTVEGTDSFSTFQYNGNFLAHPSVLEKSANPELHTVWDNITSVIWIGTIDRPLSAYNEIYYDLRFTRTDGGKWPELAEDETIPVSMQSYTCVRGQDCDNVKNWRWMIVGNKEVPIRREDSGTVYALKSFSYKYFLGDIVVERVAWRVVISSDPGGAVSACLAQDFCRTSVDYVTHKINIAAFAFFKLIIFVIFFVLYVTWILNLLKKVGKPRKWSKENCWLLVIGTGVILQSGIGHTILQFTALISDDYEFKEGEEFAMIVISYFGFTMVMYGFICFVDGPRRFISDFKQFYIAKLVYAFIYFSFATVVAVYRFPKVSGLDQPGTDTQIGRLGFTTSPESWSTKEQRIYVSLLIILQSLEIIAFIWFIKVNIQTRYVLKKLPYGMTRPTQISYSYFSWAMNFYIIMRAVGLILDVLNAINFNREFLLSSINGLNGLLLVLDSFHYIRNIWDPSSLLFFYVFSLIYMRMFLPPSESQIRNARTHYKTEAELSEVKNNSTKGKDIEEFVVLDRARLLVICSREAYLPFDEKERSQFCKNDGLEGDDQGEDDILERMIAPRNSILTFLRRTIKLEIEEDDENMEGKHESKSKSQRSQEYTKLSIDSDKNGFEISDDKNRTNKMKADDEYIEPMECINEFHSRKVMVDIDNTEKFSEDSDISYRSKSVHSSHDSDISFGEKYGDNNYIKDNRRTSKAVKWPSQFAMKAHKKAGKQSNYDQLESCDDQDSRKSSVADINLKTRARLTKAADSFVLHEQITGKNILRIAGTQPKRSLHAKTGSTYSMGCRVVARITEPEKANFHDTKCTIFRQELSGDLIVAFRGTKTNKQIKTDIMMSRIAVDLDTFLAITHPRKRAHLKAQGLLDAVSLAALLEKLNIGQIPKVRLSALLPRAEMKPLPNYLENACKDDNNIHGTARIHFGFWSSYNRVREDVHRVVREELLRRPGRLMITGHSLGGALGTLCAYDMCRWVIPTVKQELSKNPRNDGQVGADAIKLSCYTYGSPKVGNTSFSRAFNKVVPNSCRIVCDGDLITANPAIYLGYHHVGKAYVFDKTGCIVVNPSLIEKKFGFTTRMKVTSHMMTNYMKVIKQAYVKVDTEEDMLGIMKAAYEKNTCKPTRLMAGCIGRCI